MDRETLYWIERLVDGCKVLSWDGQGDLISGHVSCRAPAQSDRFYLKPSRFGLEEIDAAQLIEVNLEGEKVAGELGLHNEVFIHTEIYRVRPDVRCVVHTHAPHAVAFSSTGRPLLPIGHEGTLFADGLPVFSETTDGIVTRERGEKVAALLGEHRALLLQNHGLVTVGATVEEAVMTAVWLEKACRLQMIAYAMGGPTRWTDPAEAEIKRRRIYTPEAMRNAFAYCVRKVREAQARDR
ncbi:MAG: class II aldolase/adducin family protein [Firmicutes bacterium]|nr:class II aldolase/adducin family protein [Bacillota bacterium]